MSTIPKTDFYACYDALPLSAKEALIPSLQIFSNFVRYYESGENTQDDQPTMNDYDHEQFAARRARLVRAIYGCHLHAEFVDRIMLCLVNGFTTGIALRMAVNEAQKAFMENRITEVWQGLVSWVRDVWTSHGYAWRPTAPPLEPTPPELIEQERRERIEAARLRHTLASIENSSDRVHNVQQIRGAQS